MKGEKKLVKVGNYVMTGRVLGKGHFARVQEATHIHLNIKVAVKVLTFSEIKDDYVIKNMRREAKILAKVSHPNVIYLFETITTTKRYYIITELVNGGDLCTYITSQRNGKLNEKQTRPLARQIIAAVGHLHERGIVHRDLKMENILLDEKKEIVKLVDFGLSNYRRGVELLQTHCGSPEYAAPELYISGRHYGPEVDIWSLGIIFYGMLVGKLPFQSWHKTGLTPEAKRKQLIRETKIGLTQRHQKYLLDLSLLFQNLIEKMICPNPDERITMLNLQTHAWIYGRFCREYPQVDTPWKRKTVMKISKMCEMTSSDVCRTIEAKRYSPLAGIYNIAKLHEMQRRVDEEEAKIETMTKGTSQVKKKQTHPNQTNARHSQKESVPIKNVVITCRHRGNQKPPQPTSPKKGYFVEPKDRPKPTKPVQKTPFTLGSISTPSPRRSFSVNFRAALNKMLNKQKSPPMHRVIGTTPTQKNEPIVEKKTKIGVPKHTAARAMAKAEIYRRARKQ